MAKVSISEAARLAGISRQHLYKKWITPGLLSIDKASESAPLVDTSELMRVFGTLHGSHEPVQASLSLELATLRQQLADRNEQLREAQEREMWLRNHVAEVTGTMRLLENRSPAGLDQVQLQLQKARRVINSYKMALEAEREALDAERSKGFWRRLFG